MDSESVRVVKQGWFGRLSDPWRRVVLGFMGLASAALVASCTSCASTGQLGALVDTATRAAGGAVAAARSGDVPPDLVEELGDALKIAEALAETVKVRAQLDTLATEYARYRRDQEITRAAEHADYEAEIQRWIEAAEAAEQRAASAESDSARLGEALVGMLAAEPAERIEWLREFLGVAVVDGAAEAGAE